MRGRPRDERTNGPLGAWPGPPGLARGARERGGALGDGSRAPGRDSGGRDSWHARDSRHAHDSGIELLGKEEPWLGENIRSYHRCAPTNTFPNRFKIYVITKSN